MSQKKTSFWGSGAILICALCTLLALLFAPPCRTGPPPKPTVVLITLDGVRWDYPGRDALPGFADMARAGTSAKRLLPAFPPMTQASHATLATGCLPHKHGIVSNSFLVRETGQRFKSGPEAAWLQEPPLWVLSEKAGLRSAVAGWPCSQGPWKGVSPTDDQKLEKNWTDRQTVEWVLDLLRRPAATRPSLVMAWTGGADGEGHDEGPDGASVHRAMRRVDGLLSDLRREIRGLGSGVPVTLFVVSDHGMAPVERALDLAPLIPKKGFYPFIATAGPICNLYVKGFFQKRDVAKALKKLPPEIRVFEKGQTPESWRYRDNPRIGDFVLLAPRGEVLVFRRDPEHPLAKGNHGWDPAEQDMQGIFYAEGPGVPAGKTLDSVRAVDLAPSVCALLGIPPPPHTDGTALFR